jgi:hypothetical protein
MARVWDPANNASFTEADFTGEFVNRISDSFSVLVEGVKLNWG